MGKRVDEMESDSKNDFIEVLEVAGNNYERNWVYTNRFPYI
jgi:hypothetical protein